MKLKVGQKAPYFKTTDVNGNNIDLKEYKDKKLILAFLRYAGCPFCNRILQNIIKQLDLLETEDVNVIAFFQSPSETVKEYPAKLQPSFPIVPQPNKEIYDLYGVQSSVMGMAKKALDLPLFYDTLIKEGYRQGKIDGDFFLMPAYFLISPPDLTIRKTHYGVNFADDTPILDIRQFIDYGYLENN